MILEVEEIELFVIVEKVKQNNHEFIGVKIADGKFDAWNADPNTDEYKRSMTINMNFNDEYTREEFVDKFKQHCRMFEKSEEDFIILLEAIHTNVERNKDLFGERIKKISTTFDINKGGKE